MEEELARVESVFIGCEDHGILTIILMLEGADSGWGQSYGTFSYGSRSMDEDKEWNQWDDEARKRHGLALSRTLIGLCGGFGVDNILDLKGTMLWVQREKPFGTIEAIRPLKGTAINFRDYFPPQEDEDAQ